MSNGNFVNLLNMNMFNQKLAANRMHVNPSAILLNQMLANQKALTGMSMTDFKKQDNLALNQLGGFGCQINGENNQNFFVNQLLKAQNNHYMSE